MPSTTRGLPRPWTRASASARSGVAAGSRIGRGSGPECKKRTKLPRGRAGRAGRRGSGGGAGGAGRCPSTPGGAPCRRRGRDSHSWCCHYCWCCCCLWWWCLRKGTGRRGHGGHSRVWAGESEGGRVARVVSEKAARRGGRPENPASWANATMWSGRFQRSEAGIQVKCFTGKFFFSSSSFSFLLLRHRRFFLVRE